MYFKKKCCTKIIFRNSYFIFQTHHFLGFCTVMDKKYKIKRTFVPNSCRGFCQCNGPSSMKCTPLCPQKKITCAAGEKKIVATTKVILNPRCTCEILKCVRKKSTFVSLWENLFGGKSRSWSIQIFSSNKNSLEMTLKK